MHAAVVANESSSLVDARLRVFEFARRPDRSSFVFCHPTRLRPPPSRCFESDEDKEDAPDTDERPARSSKTETTTTSASLDPSFRRVRFDPPTDHHLAHLPSAPLAPTLPLPLSAITVPRPRRTPALRPRSRLDPLVEGQHLPAVAHQAQAEARLPREDADQEREEDHRAAEGQRDQVPQPLTGRLSVRLLSIAEWAKAKAQRTRSGQQRGMTRGCRTIGSWCTVVVQAMPDPTRGEPDREKVVVRGAGLWLRGDLVAESARMCVRVREGLLQADEAGARAGLPSRRTTGDPGAAAPPPPVAAPSTMTLDGGAW